MTTYTLTTRAGKGSRLSITEGDNNLTYFNNSKIVSVKDYGAVEGGSTDCTAAFQAAVDAEDVIFVPEGIYLIAGQVTMRSGVKIYGVSRHSTLRPGSGLVTIGGGSIIYITSTSASPFKYYSGNHFEGLTFYYPNQLRTAGTPTVYPATFTFSTANMSEVLVNNSWHKCQFVNSYIWIDALRGHLDFEFYELVGCAIHRGIITDGCGGTDVFRSIRISYYYWCQFTDAIVTYIQANAQGIAIGRSDAFHMDRIYCGTMNVGVRFFVGSVNTVSGPYGSITGLSLDGNNYGIYAEGTHGVGVNVVDAMINSILFDVECASSTAASLLSITGGRMWGAKTRNIRVNVASCVLVLNSIEFFSSTAAAISIGAASCDVIVGNCRFSDSSTSPLTTTAQGNVLVLTGNLFNIAPSLHTTPATIYRFKGNTYLMDRGVGGGNQPFGTGTINSGATSAIVTHGLDFTPSLGQITIVGGEDPTNAVGTIWVSAIGATTFTVNVENDPGASNWDFGWSVR